MQKANAKSRVIAIRKYNNSEILEISIWQEFGNVWRLVIVKAWGSVGRVYWVISVWAQCQEWNAGSSANSCRRRREKCPTGSRNKDYLCFVMAMNFSTCSPLPNSGCGIVSKNVFYPGLKSELWIMRQEASFEKAQLCQKKKKKSKVEVKQDVLVKKISTIKNTAVTFK